MDAQTSAIVVRRSWRRRAYFDQQLDGELAARLWHDPHALLANAESLRKVGARSTVRLAHDNASYVLKHYAEPTWRHALKQTVWRSRARTTWLVARKMAAAGIATPRPVACVENRQGPFRSQSYLLYRYVEGDTLRNCLQQEADLPMLSQLLEQLLALFVQLRQLRISLADTNLRNFIVGDGGQLWVIDVDKARFHRMAFLAQLHHQRGWRQFVRHAQKTGQLAQRLAAELCDRLEPPRLQADLR